MISNALLEFWQDGDGTAFHNFIEVFREQCNQFIASSRTVTDKYLHEKNDDGFDYPLTTSCLL